MHNTTNQFDVIICGAGHAGCEAALASARMGAKTLLLTGNLDTIGQMSCNPAIGGQAKGHIVCEIDGLGGEMAVNADTTAIQYRLLNSSKGPAVQSPRAQCDKKAYQFRMKHTIELQKNLTTFQAIATGLTTKNGRITGVETNLLIDFHGKTVIVTTGTFLKAQMHIGTNQHEGGRMGDFSAKTLSKSFMEAGIELERLKTGTPARILGSTIDFSKCEEQPGDIEPTFFANYDTREEELFHVEQYGQKKLGWQPGADQISCWVTRTTEKTQEIVTQNLKRSALYCGEISGTGPRYCPSIEDKYVKFSDKNDHRIFLEPEGRNTDEWYINGLSTSLPYDVQTEMLHSVTGLENAHMLRPGYAVEYDFAPPTQLFPTLESKKIENLFFAGQINGTTGYEEAAGQGILAGINAASKTIGLEPLILKRHDGYIGVLVDDLVTKGTSEPYRMFTSRAEYRLLFNSGSAELRMLPYTEKYKLTDDKRLQKIKEKHKNIIKWVEVLENTKTKGGIYADLIRRNIDVAFPSDFEHLSKETKKEVLYRIKYKGYLERDLRQIRKSEHNEKIKIPQNFDYNKVKGLRKEALTKLSSIMPANLGQASRISGVNPVDIDIIAISLRS